MFRQILECDSLVWVNFKGTGKEFSQGLGVFLGERRIVLDFHLLKVEALVALGHDLILHIDTFEGKVSKEHFVQQHAYSPHINLSIIYLFLEDLWRHVGSCPAESTDIIVVLSAEA